MPLPQANPVTARLCEEQCHQLLVQRYRKGSVAARVRRRLLQQPGRFPDMEAMAEELTITSRTLRRQLAAEGTSYRVLLDEVRRMLAEQWLLLGILSLAEISERLGFLRNRQFQSRLPALDRAAPRPLSSSAVETMIFTTQVPSTVGGCLQAEPAWRTRV